METVGRRIAMPRCLQLRLSRRDEVDVEHVREAHQIDEDVTEFLGCAITTPRLGEPLDCSVCLDPLEQLRQFPYLTDEREDERLRIVKPLPASLGVELADLVAQMGQVAHPAIVSASPPPSHAQCSWCAASEAG